MWYILPDNIPRNKTIPAHFEVPLRVCKVWCNNVDFEVWRVTLVNTVKMDFLKLSVILQNRLAELEGVAGLAEQLGLAGFAGYSSLGSDL